MITEDFIWKDVEYCDIQDRSRLTRARPKLKRWKILLAGSDSLSIEQQLLELAWQDAVYRTFNEGLRLNEKSASPHPLPGTIVELFHDRYFKSQTLLLRRLFEKYSPAKKKGVYSIPTAVHEIQRDVSLLSREIYVCYDGIFYDSNDERHDWKTRLHCKTRHRVFDSICDRIGDDRFRTDTIRVDILRNVEERISTANKRLTYHVNKYIAHASDPLNRKPPKAEPALISLSYLQNLHKTAIWATKTVGKAVDELAMTEVSVPQFDQLQNWDAIFGPKIKNALYRYWDKRVALFRKWSSTYWDTDSIKKYP